MKNIEAETILTQAPESITSAVSPLSDPANHVRQPLSGVQPIHDVEDFVKGLPHVTPDEDDGFYEAILDLRRRRRSVMQEKSS